MGYFSGVVRVLKENWPFATRLKQRLGVQPKMLYASEAASLAYSIFDTTTHFFY